jgi:hypothetical protein
MARIPNRSIERKDGPPSADDVRNSLTQLAREKPPSKKRRSYEILATGQLVVNDERQFTNGQIIPNYLVDLYLPIIGYAGLGILTALYRLGTYANRVPNLTEFAAAGGMGYRSFVGHLETLEDCGLIRVERPSNRDRAAHKGTRISLTDALQSVAPELANHVQERTLVQWQFDAAS